MTGAWGSTQPSTWMLRIQTQVLMLACQALYLASVPSSQSHSVWLLTSSKYLTSEFPSAYLKPSLDLTQEPQPQLLGNQFHSFPTCSSLFLMTVRGHLVTSMLVMLANMSINSWPSSHQEMSLMCLCVMMNRSAERIPDNDIEDRWEKAR